MKNKKKLNVFGNIEFKLTILKCKPPKKQSHPLPFSEQLLQSVLLWWQ